MQCVETCSLPGTPLPLVVPPQLILVLGNTGSGKTTLAKHLARHDADLEAVEEGSRILIHGDHVGSSVQSVTKVTKCPRA